MTGILPFGHVFQSPPTQTRKKHFYTLERFSFARSKSSSHLRQLHSYKKARGFSQDSINRRISSQARPRHSDNLLCIYVIYTQTKFYNIPGAIFTRNACSIMELKTTQGFLFPNGNGLVMAKRWRHYERVDSGIKTIS